MTGLLQAFAIPVEAISSICDTQVLSCACLPRCLVIPAHISTMYPSHAPSRRRLVADHLYVGVYVLNQRGVAITSWFIPMHAVQNAAKPFRPLRAGTILGSATSVLPRDFDIRPE